MKICEDKNTPLNHKNKTVKWHYTENMLATKIMLLKSKIQDKLLSVLMTESVYCLSVNLLSFSKIKHLKYSDSPCMSWIESRRLSTPEQNF